MFFATRRCLIVFKHVRPCWPELQLNLTCSKQRFKLKHLKFHPFHVAWHTIGVQAKRSSTLTTAPFEKRICITIGLINTVCAPCTYLETRPGKHILSSAEEQGSTRLRGTVPVPHHSKCINGKVLLSALGQLHWTVSLAASTHGAPQSRVRQIIASRLVTY